MGLDVKLLLLPVARTLTLVGSGSCSPAWLISLCDGEASAEGVDVVPIWYVGAGARSERRRGLGGVHLNCESKMKPFLRFNVFAEK